MNPLPDHIGTRCLGSNLYRLGGLGVSGMVIQQILRHANVTTTINIYVKTVSSDATAAMKMLETMCAATVQPMPLAKHSGDVEMVGSQMLANFCAGWSYGNLAEREGFEIYGLIDGA
jgi:hypothetical protein